MMDGPRQLTRSVHSLTQEKQVSSRRSFRNASKGEAFSTTSARGAAAVVKIRSVTVSGDGLSSSSSTAAAGVLSEGADMWDGTTDLTASEHGETTAVSLIFVSSATAANALATAALTTAAA